METADDKILKFEQKLYSFVVNTASLLKSLKKCGIENQNTQKIAVLAGNSHVSFSNYLNSKDINILEEIKRNLTEIKDILVSDFEGISNDISHEKADLYIECNIVLKELLTI